MDDKPTVQELPALAYDTLYRALPETLTYSAERHSDHCYSVVVLTSQFKYYECRLNLSLDERWSLVPVTGWEDTGLSYASVEEKISNGRRERAAGQRRGWHGRWE